jgi:hypothetical protein
LKLDETKSRLVDSPFQLSLSWPGVSVEPQMVAQREISKERLWRLVSSWSNYSYNGLDGRLEKR